MRSGRGWLVTFTGVAGLLFGPAAWAECTTDADCPTGLTCIGVEAPCDVADAPCACTCSSEETDCKCDCPEVTDTPNCEPTTVHVCSFVECTTDAECGTGFSCQETGGVCSGSGGSGGGTACTCVDCEPGTDCPPCTCDEATDMSEAPPVEECTATSHHCLPVEKACTTDAECGEGWSCAEVGGGTSTDTACVCEAVCAEGQTDCTDAPDCTCDVPEGTGEPASAEKMCLPEGLLPSIEDGSTRVPEGAAEEVFGKGSDNGSPVTDTAGNGTDQSVTGGAGDSGTRSSSSSSSGCSAVPVAGGASGLLVLLALGAMALLRRRRVA